MKKKCSKEDTVDKIFGSSFLQDNIFQEDNLDKNQFSLSTQEHLEDLVSKEDNKKSQNEASVKTLSREKESKSLGKSNYKPKKQKITQKIRSFENRTRFGK
uniref:Uncharacterized protein n=1 Tax=Euplotes crassus TaxID=5936 RepID=A0A7S3NXG5_EUPCR|mmetsp:Transcript_30193/g.29686  ORF Transcript_30193/g.29686 Transcript_30193/m.29686 type:complete len:101 (+) Transcript_30193:165-467(+)